MRLGTIDFETHAITDINTHPEPVSVALLPHRGKPIWLAWGHPTANNCTRGQAIERLARFIAEHSALLFHRAAFDVGILVKRLGFDLRGKSLHDTMVALFLRDPYRRSLELKPAAAEMLGMPPDEREAVRDWLIEHGIVSKQLKREWAAHICDAPGDLVGRYAIGDVVRTRKLFEHLDPVRTQPRYTAEMRVVSLCVDMNRRGVPVDTDAIEADERKGTKLLGKTDNDIRKILRADIDIDSTELGGAIEARFGVLLPRTATGKVSKARETVLSAVPDQHLQALLSYRSALAYSIRNYSRPWLKLVRNGRVHPEWHSTRSDKATGARTGRFSSSPNFQNMKDPENQDKLLAQLRALWPRKAFWLPDIRRYVKAEKGKVLIGADYSQIELRLAAEFEDGPIAARYTADPKMDLHQWAIDLILANSGVRVMRRIAKNVGFGILYGAGGRAISAQAGVSYDEAVHLRALYLAAFPSLKGLMYEVQSIGKRGQPITTLGGRQYHAEPARIQDGQWRSYEYKLLNYLIQGSAADLMKQAMLEYVDSVDYTRLGDELIMTVHDEEVAQVDAGCAAESRANLQRTMLTNSIARKLHVPVLAETYQGDNWLEVA